MTEVPALRFPIPPASPAALEVARTWPLLMTNDVSHRLTPDGERRAAWMVHIRCAYSSCRQSVFCASNDSGPYVWTWRDHLAVGVLGHIMQCHRAESGVDKPEVA